MGKANFVEASDGRLATRLAMMLPHSLQDALDHPVRREILRALTRDGRSHSLSAIRVEFRDLPVGQLNYHLQVLRRSGAMEESHALQVRGVLRATGEWDKRRREEAVAKASPLLTMFRVPRPVRTIRLRGKGSADAERES